MLLKRIIIDPVSEKSKSKTSINTHNKVFFMKLPGDSFKNIISVSYNLALEFMASTYSIVNMFRDLKLMVVVEAVSITSAGTVT